MTKKNINWVNDLRQNFWSLFLNGITFTLVALFFIYGITTGALALVSGIKKLEVFFVLIFSMIFLGEKPKTGVWIGSLIMLFGVILIKLG